MSGLIALFDDVAAIAKLAAASVDDVVAGASKTGAKVAGVVIDDTAVTPKYIDGLSPKRELPIILRIARGSLLNKLVFLLPVAILLERFAPWMIAPLLMIGGAFLCFEGAEKVFHVLFAHGNEHVQADMDTTPPEHLEETKVRGAIKTDFILSAEIMTISLAAIPDGGLAYKTATLALVATVITLLVYGSVALIVKLDDIGLWLARTARTGIGRGFGRGMVRAMPWVMWVLTVIGTVAMLWVGGSIMIHGLHDVFHLNEPGHSIHAIAESAAHAVPALAGLLQWSVTAALDALFGLVFGLVLIPIVTRVITPVFAALGLGGKASH